MKKPFFVRRRRKGGILIVPDERGFVEMAACCAAVPWRGQESF